MIAEDRDCHNARLHIRGNHKNLGEEVPRRFLQVIAGEQQPPITSGSGRLHIANWMASADNPLTARVMVNRIWKHHFGAGIVRSTDNFGKMGEAPTHPELLDYLASRFVEGGWSVKSMHRLIVLSAAYQMSSAAERGIEEGRSREQASAAHAGASPRSRRDSRHNPRNGRDTRRNNVRTQRAALYQRLPGWPRQAEDRAHSMARAGGVSTSRFGVTS